MNDEDKARMLWDSTNNGTYPAWDKATANPRWVMAVDMTRAEVRKENQ